MANTKKPSAKQLAARKKFAQMAKDGTLAKKRKAASKKKGLKAAALPKGMKKVIAKTVKIEGLSKTTGQLLPGYYYAKGGKIKKSNALKEKEKKTCKK